MTGAADWRMPATVRGQRSGCGAAYQSGRRPRPEISLADRTTAEGPHLLGVFCTTVSVFTADTALSSAQEVRSAVSRNHRRDDVASRCAHSTLRHQLPAFVRSSADGRTVALGGAMARPRHDRQPGVPLGSVRGVSVTARLRLRRLEQLRHPAGEPVPCRMAWPVEGDVACAGALADPVRRGAIRVPGSRSCVPGRARLVLTSERNT